MPSRRISEVGKAFMLKGGRSGVRILLRARNVFFSSKSKPARGVSSVVLSGCWASFPVIRRPENDADGSLPSNDKIKWSCTSTPLTRHHVVSRDLTFTFALNKGHRFKYIHCLLCAGHADILNFWRLMATIVVVPHRYPLNFAFYIFIQQIQVLNSLNMVYTVLFSLFKMQFVS